MREHRPRKGNWARRAGRAGVFAAAALTMLATVGAAYAAEMTNLHFTLDRKFEGPAAPLVLALDSGYYKAEGLNVSIDPAASVSEAVTRVASGDYDMGIADINVVIKHRDTNPNDAVKAVFVIYNRPAFAVIGRKSRGIKELKDLEGHKLGAPIDSDSFDLWPILVKANGIDASKVAIENIGFQVRTPMLAAGQVDAITGLSFSTYIDLKDRGVPADDIIVLPMADYGVVLYGAAIIVNSSFAEAHPDAVKGFLRAYLRGLKRTVAAPATALEHVMSRIDSGRKNLELERLKMVINHNIITPEVRANGYGAIDGERFAQGIDQLTLAYKFKEKPKLGEIFDPSFLPPAAERKLN